jgi:hypothetical protein
MIKEKHSMINNAILIKRVFMGMTDWHRFRIKKT